MILNIILTLFVIWYGFYSLSFLKYLKAQKNYKGVVSYGILSLFSGGIFVIKFILM